LRVLLNENGFLLIFMYKRYLPGFSSASVWN